MSIYNAQCEKLDQVFHLDLTTTTPRFEQLRQPNDPNPVATICGRIQGLAGEAALQPTLPGTPSCLDMLYERSVRNAILKISEPCAVALMEAARTLLAMNEAGELQPPLDPGEKQDMQHVIVTVTSPSHSW